MPIDPIAKKLKEFRTSAQEDRKYVKELCEKSPFERTRQEVQEQIGRAEKYRASILRNITTFGGLNDAAILSAAQSMEEVFYVKGNHVIEQDEIGDSFFILEEGLVKVTRKMDPKDPNEVPKELARLPKNCHFGEVALLTAEPRSATITVISDEAKCLKMTKSKFEELLATTNKLQAESRKQIGRDVLDTVPMFKALTTVNKKKLLEAMIPMTYLPGSYICRQGTTGNTFFILTEGECRVTVNTDDHNEKQVASLRGGDFFGEVALIESSNRRTANVISNSSVSCLTLSRTDFHRLLRNLKVKIMEHQAIRSASNPQSNNSEMGGELRQVSSLAKKRRISGYNSHGQRDEVRIANLFRRFAKFSMESLWNSMYSRMYREMFLDPTRVTDYGKFATLIMRNHGQDRAAAMKAISEQAVRILEMDCGRRTSTEHAFVVGLLNQRNAVKSRLCKNWPAHQFAMLCKKIKIIRIKPFRKIVEADTKGTTAFLILRGCVRIFGKVQRSEGAQSGKAFYEEDLCPGEMFGEAALTGMHTRMLTALAVTTVDLIVIDDQDFMMVQDRDTMLMGTEERAKYLQSIPLFKDWDSYKLIRLAHALVQEDVPKNAVLFSHNNVSKDMYFIVHGRVDVVDSLEKKNVITSLMVGDYFGESGFINRFVKAINNKVHEEFYAIAATRLDVLILQESNFNLFDLGSLDSVKSAFHAKVEWRKQRVIAMKLERAKVRKNYYLMRVQAEMLAMRPDNHHDSDEDDSIDNNRRVIVIDRSTKPKSHDDDVDNNARETMSSMKKLPEPHEALLSIQASSQAAKPMPILSKLDVAYQAALVHPLDDRLQHPDAWRSTGPSNKHKDQLDNLEDIPTVLSRDFDLLMVSAGATRDPKRYEKLYDLIAQSRKMLTFNAEKAKADLQQNIIFDHHNHDNDDEFTEYIRKHSGHAVSSKRPISPSAHNRQLEKEKFWKEKQEANAEIRKILDALKLENMDQFKTNYHINKKKREINANRNDMYGNEVLMEEDEYRKHFYENVLVQYNSNIPPMHNTDGDIMFINDDQLMNANTNGIAFVDTDDVNHDNSQGNSNNNSKNNSPVANKSTRPLSAPQLLASSPQHTVISPDRNFINNIDDTAVPDDNKVEEDYMNKKALITISSLTRGNRPQSSSAAMNTTTNKASSGKTRPHSSQPHANSDSNLLNMVHEELGKIKDSRLANVRTPNTSRPNTAGKVNRQVVVMQSTVPLPNIFYNNGSNNNNNNNISSNSAKLPRAKSTSICVSNTGNDESNSYHTNSTNNLSFHGKNKQNQQKSQQKPSIYTKYNYDSAASNLNNSGNNSNNNSSNNSYSKNAPLIKVAGSKNNTNTTTTNYNTIRNTPSNDEDNKMNPANETVIKVGNITITPLITKQMPNGLHKGRSFTNVTTVNTIPNTTPTNSAARSSRLVLSASATPIHGNRQNNDETNATSNADTNNNKSPTKKKSRATYNYSFSNHVNSENANEIHDSFTTRYINNAQNTKNQQQDDHDENEEQDQVVTIVAANHSIKHGTSSKSHTPTNLQQSMLNTPPISEVRERLTSDDIADAVSNVARIFTDNNHNLARDGFEGIGFDNVALTPKSQRPKTALSHRH